jgi:hypothetical protein
MSQSLLTGARFVCPDSSSTRLCGSAPNPLRRQDIVSTLKRRWIAEGRANMNTLSIFRKASRSRLLLSACVAVAKASVIWIFFACNAAQAERILGNEVLSFESPILQARQAKDSDIGQKRTGRSEARKNRSGMKSPRGSHIRQEIDQHEKMGPEPFADPEQPIHRKVRRALA